MRFAFLFAGLLGCSEYGLGGDALRGDYGIEGDGPVATGEADTAGGADDFNGDGDAWDTGAYDDVTWDDDGDYVPEIGEGCDEATDMDAIQIDDDGKVLVCHATGSGSNASVLINIDVAGCEEHRAHQGGQDGVPSYGCLP